MKHNPIIQRCYIKGKLTVLSPLLIGGGSDERTDIDIIRDAEGKPFIPGTSLAGILRHYLDYSLTDKNENEHDIITTLFGKTEKNSTLSLLMISDALLQKDSAPDISVRDGLKIDYITGTVDHHQGEDDEYGGGAKYDYEIIEPGVSFDLKMELVIRANNSQYIDTIYSAIAFLLNHLQEGKIRIGAKTRRGMGRIKLDDTAILKLDMNNKKDVETWMDFDWKGLNFQSNITLTEVTTGSLKIRESSDKTISVLFSIPYSILIRHYNSDPSDDDSSHLMSNGKFVIPGTSWNGALRHSIHSQLIQIMGKESEKKVEEIITGMFGKIDKKAAKASRVMIDESIIEKEHAMSYTRNKVDRFTGGVVDSALFSEKPVYGGNVSINITLMQPKEWEPGILLLGLKDLSNGIQPVGGAANIGRGILKADINNIFIDGIPLTPEIEKQHFKLLYNKCIKEKKGETNG